MELDELKQNWNAMSNRLNNQPIINGQLIDQMTQNKFRSQLKKITYPEIIGILICLAGAVFIGLNFYKLDTFFLQVVGLMSMLLILAICILSFLSIQKLNSISDFTKPVVETLKAFTLIKKKFHQLQRINIMICHLLFLTIVILLIKFFGTNVLVDSKYLLIFSFTLGNIFLLFYSRWVIKNYNNTLKRTEELLRELQA